METLRSQDLLALMKAPKADACITIYLGLGVTADERRSARLRLRRLLRKAKQGLYFSHAAAEAEDLLKPLFEKSRGFRFEAPREASGIVFFRSRNLLATHFVKHEIEDYVAVADSFHLKPLVNTIQGLNEYYAIVLSHKLIRFYEGNNSRLLQAGRVESPVTEDRFPSSADTPAESLENFFHRAAEQFKELAADHGRPVVLVGSPRLCKRFREVCPLRSFASDDVSATLVSADEALIHRCTWAIAEREFARIKGGMASHFQKHRGTALACDDLPSIANASMIGRVSDLLICEEDRVFGRLDRSNGAVDFYSPETCPFGDDVLCDIAQEVVQHGGTAVLLPKREMPTDAPAAAALRW